ncbi:MAG: AAA family ATPase [Candidatus Moranbacteria bacterium]|nr:AAA family ATPase [Candidatus Moranbacteria bacterium]
MKKIIGLVGEIASGKGTVSKYLQEKHNAKVYRFSDVLREILSVLYLDCDRKNLSELSLCLRETFGEDILSNALVRKVLNDEHDLIILDGVRRKEELKFFDEIEGFQLVYVECDIKDRYKRIIERGENMDDKNKTFEDFKKDHERDAEIRIRELKERADKVIDNDGSLEELYDKVDKILTNG